MLISGKLLMQAVLLLYMLLALNMQVVIMVLYHTAQLLVLKQI